MVKITRPRLFKGTARDFTQASGTLDEHIIPLVNFRSISMGPEEMAHNFQVSFGLGPRVCSGGEEGEVYVPFVQEHTTATTGPPGQMDTSGGEGGNQALSPGILKSSQGNGGGGRPEEEEASLGQGAISHEGIFEGKDLGRVARLQKSVLHGRYHAWKAVGFATPLFGQGPCVLIKKGELISRQELF